jgi:hypothetical protein
VLIAHGESKLHLMSRSNRIRKNMSVDMFCPCIGAFIKTVQLRVAPLDKFDVIIGQDLIDECKMEVRWDPFRITALTRTAVVSIRRSNLIEGRHNIVPDTLSRFPQEDGESFEHLIAPGNMETTFSHHLDTVVIELIKDLVRSFCIFNI